MSLNKVKTGSNMYQGWLTHTWNPIKGRCEHGCTYCYMERFWSMMKNDELRLDEKELKTDLGEGNIIFVGSSTDMWASNVSYLWIEAVLGHVRKYPKNTYLFQSKYPQGMAGWEFDDNMILGITLETNRSTENFSKAPIPEFRAEEFAKIEHLRKMITIEPIMNFGVRKFPEMIKSINPEWVNVGADSGGNKLPEPPNNLVDDLVGELKQFTEVKIKTNLKRIMIK